MTQKYSQAFKNILIACLVICENWDGTFLADGKNVHFPFFFGMDQQHILQTVLTCSSSPLSCPNHFHMTDIVMFPFNSCLSFNFYPISTTSFVSYVKHSVWIKKWQQVTGWLVFISDLHGVKMSLAIIVNA